MTTQNADLAAPKTYTIPECKLTTLKTTLDKMIRKASKLGIEACSYTVGNHVDVPYTTRFDLDAGGYRSVRFQGDAEELKVAENNGKIHYKRFIEVTIAGPNPVLAGWSFVATLQHLTDDKNQPLNMLRTSPTFEGKLPERFHNSTAQCDHCKAIRNRKDTYVVQNVATGEWKQIGSSCIKDFTGGNDPRSIAAILEWWLDTQRECQDDDDDDEGGSMGGGRGGCRYSLRDFLATTAAVIRTEGWMPRSKAQDEGCAATADLVLMALENRPMDHQTALLTACGQPANTEVDKAESFFAAREEEAAHGRD